MLTVVSTPLKRDYLVNFALTVHKLYLANYVWHNFPYLCLDFKDCEVESTLEQC